MLYALSMCDKVVNLYLLQIWKENDLVASGIVLSYLVIYIA